MNPECWGGLKGPSGHGHVFGIDLMDICSQQKDFKQGSDMVWWPNTLSQTRVAEWLKMQIQRNQNESDL